MLFLDKTIRHYQATKSALKDFHSELFKHVEKKHYIPCARSLGMYKKKALYFDSEICFEVFIDYAIYSWPEKGESPVDKVIATDLNRRSLLSGMQRNVFSLFKVDIIGNYRLRCTDLFREGLVEEVIDINMSKYSSPSYVYASRLLKFDEFCCFTGAGFPVFSEELLTDILHDVKTYCEKCNVESVSGFNPRMETIFESIIIKQCVQHKAYKYLETRDI